MTATTTSTFSNLEDTAIGIDLGTTYCAIGVCINGKVEIVPNWEEGEKLFPSYVCYPKKGNEKYGKAAKEQAYRNPETTIFDAKRIIGRSWDDPILQKDISIWPFEVVKIGDSPKIKTGTKTRYPQEISAKLLTVFRQRAEKHLQKQAGSIKKAVITVPAYFNESQRRATIEAGESAGLQVLTILNEPTAAAIAYKLQTPSAETENKTVLIYDLGGGTFDVAIVRVNKGALLTLGIDGDTHLGGQDFDNLLMEHFCKRFQQKTKINLLDRGNPEYRTPLARLRQQCEKTKTALSAGDDTFIEVQSILEDHDLSDTLTRKEFENLIENLIDKSIDIVKRAIKDARDIRSKDDIDEIILIGGSTRIPLVQTKLQKLFPGKPMNFRIHPDEAVAYGAALQASILNDPSQQRGPFIIQDVTPKSLGCVSEGGKFKVVIEKNSTVPCSNSVKFKTVFDNQTSTTIEVFQGENEVARKNEKVGVFILNGIPGRPKGQETGEILMEINRNGILSVKGTLNSTGSSSGITIEDKRMQMDKNSIATLIKELSL